MTTKKLRVRMFGKNLIVDGRTKHLVRASPGTNARARCLAKTARGKSLSERKEIFATQCKVKGK